MRRTLPCCWAVAERALAPVGLTKADREEEMREEAGLARRDAERMKTMMCDVCVG